MLNRSRNPQIPYGEPRQGHVLRTWLFIPWLAAIIALLVCGNCCTGHVIAETGEICSIQLASDLTCMIVVSSGTLGKYSFFVLDRPSCLVIDFESASIGKVISQIRVNGHPISQIRTGYNSGKARVIVDFGQNRVPQFQFLKKHDYLLVAFNKVQETSRDKLLKEQITIEAVVHPRTRSSGNQQLRKPVGTTLDKPLFRDPTTPPLEMSPARRDSLNSAELAAAEDGGTFGRKPKWQETVLPNTSIGLVVYEPSVRSLDEADMRDHRKTYRLSRDSHVNYPNVNQNTNVFGLKAKATYLSEPPVLRGGGERSVPEAMKSQNAFSILPLELQRKSPEKPSNHISGQELTPAASRGWPLHIEGYEPRARTDR